MWKNVNGTVTVFVTLLYCFGVVWSKQQIVSKSKNSNINKNVVQVLFEQPVQQSVDNTGPMGELGDAECSASQQESEVHQSLSTLCNSDVTIDPQVIEASVDVIDQQVDARNDGILRRQGINLRRFGGPELDVIQTLIEEPALEASLFRSESMSDLELASPPIFQGPPGAQGPTGPKGHPGPIGAAGDPGVDGEIGPKGIKGFPGSHGPKGVAGKKGEKGVQGPPGLLGPSGPPGKPAPGFHMYGLCYGPENDRLTCVYLNDNSNECFKQLKTFVSPNEKTDAASKCDNQMNNMKYFRCQDATPGKNHIICRPAMFGCLMGHEKQMPSHRFFDNQNDCKNARKIFYAIRRLNGGDDVTREIKVCDSEGGQLGTIKNSMEEDLARTAMTSHENGGGSGRYYWLGLMAFLPPNSANTDLGYFWEDGSFFGDADSANCGVYNTAVNQLDFIDCAAVGQAEGHLCESFTYP